MKGDPYHDYGLAPDDMPMTTPTEKSEVSIQSGPCQLCGATNYPLSFGGPSICPACDCGPNIPGLHSHIAQLQSQLTDLRAQVEQSDERCENLSTYKRRLADENAELKALLIRRREQIDKAHADGAVMRGALEHAWQHNHDEECCDVPIDRGPQVEICDVCRIVSQALSTSCGADLLARYREAVELVRLVRDVQPQAGDQMSPDWATRADTLLTTVKGTHE